MVCMIPFDMSRLDGNVKNEEQLIVHRIINQAKVSVLKLQRCLIYFMSIFIYFTNFGPIKILYQIRLSSSW